MSAILLWFFLIVGTVIVLIPLLNKLLTTDVINTINSMLNNLEYFVGSDNLTMFLCLITLLLLVIFIRFFLRFFPHN